MGADEPRSGSGAPGRGGAVTHQSQLRGGRLELRQCHVLGKDLRPYVPTSAIALLALQHRRDHPVVERSVDYLEKHATSERSGTALALALLALRVHGRRDDAVRSALIAQLPVTMTLQNHAAVALAAYALSSEQTYAAFTL